MLCYKWNIRLHVFSLLTSGELNTDTVVLIKAGRKIVYQQLGILVTIKLDIWELMDVL